MSTELDTSLDEQGSRHHADSHDEQCATCDGRTAHDVALEIVETASDRINERHRKYARGPCRVLTCRRCGTQTRTFVNR